MGENENANEPRSLTVSPWIEGKVRTERGAFLAIPAGWAHLPPGDAGLTRRVKAAGPAWTVVEKRGRKTFGRGIWAPAANIEAARAALEAERAQPAYARRLEAAARRRERAQGEYVGEFEGEVLAFLGFAPRFRAEAERFARAVTAHATPVGSGTVARTKRIPVGERAEAAVIAWLRHRTTAYDDLRIERVKGARREARRALARESRRLLDTHRRDDGGAHEAAACRLCAALAGAAGEAAAGEAAARAGAAEAAQRDLLCDAGAAGSARLTALVNPEPSSGRSAPRFTDSVNLPPPPAAEAPAPRPGDEP